jgi:hypothetical protein
MAPDSERRQTIRIAVNGNLTVESVTGGQSLRLVDVGMGGFCVRSLAALPVDFVTNYRFQSPDGRWSAIFRAKVAHSKVLPPEPKEGKPVQYYVSGLTFVNTESPSVQRELMTLLDRAMSFVSFS